jgi:hypothetical protein
LLFLLVLVLFLLELVPVCVLRRRTIRDHTLQNVYLVPRLLRTRVKTGVVTRVKRGVDTLQNVYLVPRLLRTRVKRGVVTRVKRGVDTLQNVYLVPRLLRTRVKRGVVTRVKRGVDSGNKRKIDVYLYPKQPFVIIHKRLITLPIPLLGMPGPPSYPE